MKNENNILKWFDNKLSKEEVEDLKRSEDLDTLERISFYASQLEPPRVDKQKALEVFRGRDIKKQQTKVIPIGFKDFMKVAAVVAVLLVSSYFIFFNNMKSFETRIAQTQTIVLPDASEAILNAKSELVYNKKTWNDKRDIELNGEAFFKVSKGAKFMVHTSAGMVQVLGTQFNVKKRENYFEVQCYEGLVGVTYNDKTIKLSKGKSFKVVNGDIQVVNDFVAKTPSWLDKESSFEKTPLNLVVSELERQYDLEVSLEAIDGSQLFTGSFTHKDKNTALQSITIPLNLSYRIEGNRVTIYAYGK